MRAPLTGTRLGLRGARSIASGLVGLGLAILVLCAALSAWPRETAQVLNSDLQYRMSAASAPIRDLQSTIESGVANSIQGEPADIVWASMPKALRQARAAMPASVHAIAEPGRYIGQDSGTGGRGIPMTGPPHPPAGASYTMTMEADPLLKSDAVLVQGRWPGNANEFVAGNKPLQVVMAASAAKTLRWTIGQTRELSLDVQQTEPVTLVGTVKPRDPASDYWQLDRSRSQAGSQPSLDGDHTVYSGLIWFDSGSWQELSFLFPGQNVQSWYPVNGRALTADTLNRTVADLQRFLTVPRRVGPASANVDARFSTELPTIAGDFLDRAGPASAVLSVISTGPLGTGCAVVLLGIILLIDRRRPVLTLIRSRGASERRMRWTIAGETAIGSVPGAVVGGALAYFLTPGPVSVLLVGTVIASALLPVVAAVFRIETTRVRPASRRAGPNPVRR